jgi:hypothetical protein
MLSTDWYKPEGGLDAALLQFLRKDHRLADPLITKIIVHSIHIARPSTLEVEYWRTLAGNTQVNFATITI